MGWVWEVELVKVGRKDVAPGMALQHALVQGVDGQMVKSPPEGGGGYLLSYQRFQT